MNICVTGGAGYIGSVLTDRLLHLGHQVTAVDTFLHGYHGIMRLAAHPLLRVVQRDIRHENRDYLNEQDVVFHLAAVSGAKTCEDNKAWAWAVNRDATALIAKDLHRDALLIFTSTTAIYGDRGGEEVAEEAVIHSTHGVYAQTKLDAERTLRGRDNTFILRLGTVYGISPLMRPNSIVNDFVRMAVQEKRIVLYDRLTTRPYLHIEDCVDGLLFAMKHAEEMNDEYYDLFGANYSKSHIAGTIHQQTECEILVSSERAAFVQDFMLGFSCPRNLTDDIRDLIKLYSFYRP